MQLQTYEKYKPSGIDWLGEIPEGWENYRINWINTIIRGNSSFKKDELLENGEYIALQYGKTYKVDEVNEKFNFYVNSEFYKPEQVAYRGNIILVSTSETIEDLGHTCFYDRKDLGLIGGEQILLKPKSKFVFEKYIYYYSKVFCKELRKYSTGLKVFRFNIDDLKNINISIPNKQTQTVIADYLDKHTVLIDKKIELLKAKKQNYLELKQTLINEVVTKGLDTTVEMKDSGIEWIGQIPKHWEVKRLENLINLKNGYSFDADKSFNNGINVIKMSNLKAGNIEILKNNQKWENTNLLKRFLLKENDILLGLSGSLENFAKIKNEHLPLFLNQRVCAINSKKVSFNNFIYWFIQSNIFKDQVSLFSTGTTITNLSTTILQKFTIGLPLKSEQITIANYLDEKTSKIDQIIKKIDENIFALQEFRKTLINDTVTGKVKVL